MTIDSYHEIIIATARDFARASMKALLSSHGWDHVERVVKTAERIAAAEPSADLFIVKIAALLHDIARYDEDNSGGTLCHARTGSERAYRFLVDGGLDERRSRHVAQCILSHRYRNDHRPESIEAKILFDADKLDSIGAVGIGRAFLFSGEIGAKLHNENSAVHATEAYTEEDTAYREYMVKLRFVRDTLLTEEGKRIARQRHDFMESFFDQLKREMEGND